MKVYIVIKPITAKNDIPEIIGVYKDKRTAEQVAGSVKDAICNIRAEVLR